MADDNADRDDLEDRLDRLEETLEALRDELRDERRDDAGSRMPGRAAERALRLTERVAVPAAVAALEANVRVLTFVQERLRELEGREPRTRGAAGTTPSRVSEGVLERLDEALFRLEDAMADADLPQNTEARRLLERARDLNEEVRGRMRTRPSGTAPTVIEIDVEEELEEIRDDVEAESTDGSDGGEAADEDGAEGSDGTGDEDEP